MFSVRLVGVKYQAGERVDMDVAGEVASKDEAHVWCDQAMAMAESAVCTVVQEDGPLVGRIEWDGSSISYPYTVTWY
jgi:hypothetical protein